MIIGYRRWAGTMGNSLGEKYTTSGWHEKRQALLQLLKARKHEVVLLSPPTRESQGLWDYPRNLTQLKKIQLLLVEISHHNLLFNYDSVAVTVQILNEVNGQCPIIFLYDDPALKIDIWRKDMPSLSLNLDKAVMFVNADLEGDLPDALAQRMFYWKAIAIKEIVMEKFPIAGILEYQPPTQTSIFDFAERQGLVYIGGASGGRGKKLLAMREKVPLKVFYSSGKKHPFPLDGDAPKQTERSAFYARFSANLGLADTMHKKYRWYTGRFFHALRAGTPSLIEEDNPLAEWFVPFNANNIQEQYEYIQNHSVEAVEKAQKLIPQLKSTLLLTLQKYGL